TTMRATLTASALNAAYSASPADPDLPRAASAAKASPDVIPIVPPNAAETAPCNPASQAESSVAAAVHSTCSPIIGRKMRHTPHPAAAKPGNLKGKPTDPSKSLYRIDQRLGRNVRVEHAELLPEVQPLARDGDEIGRAHV